MKFSIITPTYKRSDLLRRAVDSVLNQTYRDWEIIIINDSPMDESYHSFAASINDQRIRYYSNDRNRGVNFTRNFGLDHLSASKWVIFLDDDDFLAPDTLRNFSNLLLLEGERKWFMTNRALKNGHPLTTGARDNTTYTYAWDYLIRKKIQGDATHCIETKLITDNNIRFLKHVKQGEEWFFFYQIGLHTKLYYSDHNSTISDGYDTQSGLNFRKRSIKEKCNSLFKIFYEGAEKKLYSHLSFVIYISLRLVRVFVKK
jgi:glycosyltransferase involved in cell wall biosynthesis